MADTANEDEFLISLKSAMTANKTEELSQLLKDKKIHCSENKNGLSAIKVEDLSIPRRHHGAG